MIDAQPAFNYRYFIGRADKFGGRVLDYGCGSGRMVALGLNRGLDIWGADTFTGNYVGWASELTPQVRDRVRLIQNGHADFPDGHFDLVMSNQVLEHVTDPEAVIADIFRMIKPGGQFMAAFPVTETWYEGHVGLYFAHRFRPGSRLRRVYFDLSYRIGRGLYRENVTRKQWARNCEYLLDNVCFYYPRRRLFVALENIFGASIQDVAVDYMRTRLGDRARHIPAFVNPALRFIYHKRAGEIVKVHKST
jgi:SAM-dependent methyltransferase